MQLKTTEGYSLTVLDIRSLTSRCQQGHAPSRCFLTYSRFWWFQGILDTPCPVDTSLQSVPLLSHGIILVSLCPNIPPFIRTPLD